MRAAALALVGLVVVALAGTGRAGSGHSLAVKGPIQSISAAGGRVAIHSGEEGSCAAGAAGIVWTPQTGATVHLQDPCSSDYSFSDLALAGSTAIWWDYSAGNHVYCDDVFTASLPVTKGKGLGICDGTEGETYYELAGDSTVVAIADYSVCESDCTDANGNLLPDGDYAVEVRRAVGGKAKTVLRPVDFRTFLDAGKWRVAVIEPKNVLAVYDTGGKLVWRVTGVTGVTHGWIAGGSVVVQRGRTVQIYSSAGAGRTRTLPRRANVEDVAGGLAVYRVGSSVHLLRLADGHDARLVTVRGLVGTQLTPAGVFYAATGTVTFVPLSLALRSLA